MYATSVSYSQIYPSLLPGRQFSDLAGVYPPAGLLGALGLATRAAFSQHKDVFLDFRTLCGHDVEMECLTGQSATGGECNT